MGIYVETLIRAPIDAVWTHTQDPALHERWDLRFSGITYLPRAHDDEPQRFLYSTRIGFGLGVEGEGESAGTRVKETGEATSALRFWSEDRKSLIREGAGYWRYVPVEGGVRFLTWYDYRTRFGVFGRLLDRLIFRPLLGWATAWSFDRLRLWLERGIAPELSLARSVCHAVARWSLACVFFYQGLVPKLAFAHSDEFQMLREARVPEWLVERIVAPLGIAEMVFAVALLLAWRARWPLWLVLVLMPAVTLACLLASPARAVAAFNFVSLNLAVFTLALIGLVSAGDLPSARNCLRAQPEEARA